MATETYGVALVTRGSGAFAYTYTGPGGLKPGQLAAVRFRDRLELGVVTGVDPSPPAAAKLATLWPVEVIGQPGWGALLLALAGLVVAGPDEVAGHLLFATPRNVLKLRLSVTRPEELAPGLRSSAGVLAGWLAPKGRTRLMLAGAWEELCQAAWNGALSLEAGVAGTPGITRSHPRWRHWYRMDRRTARLLGLGAEEQVLPGSYLAGMVEQDELARLSRADEPAEPGPVPTVEAARWGWNECTWPADWDVCRRWPQVKSIPLRRRFSNWADLRAPRGLAAELGTTIAEAKNILVMAPQGWMLERIWPALSRWAAHVHLYRPEAGPSAAAHVLRQLHEPGQVVAGGPAAWKLAAYGAFDRVLLLDPSHPQYEPERHPRFDPRNGLLLALAAAGKTQLDLIELGLSAWDGRCGLKQVGLLESHMPAEPTAQRGGKIDRDPLPLVLRQPGRRRLVYFNRLGKGQGLSCIECGATVNCPRCGSPRIHFSDAKRGYRCPQCGFEQAEIRCGRCGLGTLASQLPGLEAVTRRRGDLLVYGPPVTRRTHPEVQSVLGTAALLEPLADFWPEEVVFVHAEGRQSMLADWPWALDMVARLAALYANPELQYVYLLSTRLARQLGHSLTTEQIAAAWQGELKLRRLAGLPPYGCIYYMYLRARSEVRMAAARALLGDRLGRHAGTALLRLGKPYARGSGVHLAGFAANPAVGLAELQDLRWEVFRQKVQLSFSALRGPWL